MEKLLRILFVMCAIAFVTTLTACADDKTGGNDKTTKTGGNDKTTKTGGNDKPANAGGDANTAKTAKTGGNDKPAKTPSILKFTAADAGVTIDESKDVYKITINPSLLTYKHTFLSNISFESFHPAPIFTVTFTNDKKGFIIPTTVDKADALTTTHVANQNAARAADITPGAPNGITHSFLADADADDPVFGFSATEINADWSTLGPRAGVVGGVADIEPDTKVRVSCTTTITGINTVSFAIISPAPTNDLAIAKGTETECSFSLARYAIEPAVQKAAYKAWAEAAVELAKDDSTKNIQKMGFVGIVTGDDTASDITKAAGITDVADALGVKGFTADASAKLVKAYKISFQKVEIVIAVAK